MKKIKDLIKKMDDAINRASNWKIFLISLISLTLLIFILFEILGNGLYLDTINYSKKLLISFTVSIFCSFLITSSLDISKKSVKFWNSAKELEKQIDEKNTYDELNELYKTNFFDVAKLASGQVQYLEVKRLESIMKMKAKYIK